MKVRIAIMALALGVVPFAAHAAPSTDPGFQTGSCALPAGIAPGTGPQITVDPSGNGDYTTLGAAIAAATTNAHIIVQPGTYYESVVVAKGKDGVRITGAYRNTTILDGRIYSGPNVSGYRSIGIQVYANDVLIENMTARYYSQHGFRWGDRANGQGVNQGVTGYWGRYLTSYNNGDYGIFAFDARCGQFDHSYTWGNADSGFYVGNCYPCDMVITNIVAERNALGYSGTNAGGNLTLRDSVWKGNGMGIVPNSLDSEDRPPQRGVLIEHNLITDNNGKTTPGTGIAGEYWGAGVVLAGGSGNQVLGNTVTHHDMGGIVIAPLPDSNVWIASGNTVWGNTVHHDVDETNAYDIGQGAASGPNNCWSDNDFGNSTPPNLEDVWACSFQTATPPGGSPLVELSLVEGQVPYPIDSSNSYLNGRVQSPWQTYAEPTLDKENMPANAPVSPWLPALGVDN